MGLKGIEWPERSRPETMNITHNNVLYDGIISAEGDVPVKRVKGLDQLYPVGSVCCLNLVPDGSTHTMFLRSELRL